MPTWRRTARSPRPTRYKPRRAGSHEQYLPTNLERDHDQTVQQFPNHIRMVLEEWDTIHHPDAAGNRRGHPAEEVGRDRGADLGGRGRRGEARVDHTLGESGHHV